MITDTGKGLNVLILCETSVVQEWMAYASWYSFLKNAPDANICLSCRRQKDKIYQLMNWANRLEVKYDYYNDISENNGDFNKLYAIIRCLNKKFVSNPLLVVDSDVMLLNKLDVDLFNSANFLSDKNNKIWFFNEIIPKNFENAIILFAINQDGIAYLKPEKVELCKSTKESQNSLVSILDGVGRFNAELWINKDKKCPFGKSHRFKKDDMTVNENKVLDLWSKMASLYRTIF